MLKDAGRVAGSIVFAGALAAAGTVAADEAIPLRQWSTPPYWEAAAGVPATGEREAADATGAGSEPSAVPTSALAFVGIAPCRVADSRDGSFPPGYGPPSLPAGLARNFKLHGRCGVPVSAEAVSFNFTVTNTLGAGFLLVYPAGGAQPAVSTLNYLAAQTIANAAVVPLGTDGNITVVPGVAGLDVIVDVNGYYAPVASAAVTSLNALTGAVTLTAGANVTITPSGQSLQIAAGSGASLTLPYSGNCASGSPCFRVDNNGSGYAASINGTTGKGLYASSNGENAVYGSISSSFGTAAAVYGTTNGAGAGVYGESLATNGTGVWGQAHVTGGAGVAGYSNNGYAGYFYGGPTGVYGYGTTYAGRFIGNVNVQGTLSKSGGSFRIDHPLDPENRYLSHSFVESPDMLNVYNGNVRLDERGEAVVPLPEYFEALNRDFRYQLTAIGAPAPELHVAAKVEKGRFRIAGGKPGAEVSWQVTGIRKDPWAQAHRIPVEELKPEDERGRYQHPELYGQPPTKSVDPATRREAARARSEAGR